MELKKALELRKAKKYLKRTGSPGHYKYKYEESKGRKIIKIEATEDKYMVTEKDLDKLVKKYGNRPIIIVTNCGVELRSNKKMRPLKYQNIKVIKRSKEEMSKEKIE